MKPLAWISLDAFAALLDGKTICQTMTPNHAMYNDVPICVMPSVAVKVEPVALAEFERRVDVFGEAVQSLCHFDECGTGYGRPELEVERDAARADLIDFARRMGVE